MRVYQASNKQQASKQQASKLAPQGPFRASEQLGSQNQKKNVTMLSRMVFRNFLGNNFSPPSGPQVVTKGGLLGFWPVLGRGHSEKFWARAKNRKTQFPGARRTFEKRSVRPKIFSPKLRNFFTFCGLGDQTPRGGKSQNTGFLGPFGLGRPLALRETPGKKRKNAISGC